MQVPGAALQVEASKRQARPQTSRRRGICSLAIVSTLLIAAVTALWQMSTVTEGLDLRVGLTTHLGAAKEYLKAAMLVLPEWAMAVGAVMGQALSPGPAWWSLRARGPPSMSTLERAYADLERRLKV